MVADEPSCKSAGGGCLLTVRSTTLGTLMDFVMDSGCTWHAHPHKEHLINYRQRNEVLAGCDGNTCRVEGIGDLPVLARDDQRPSSASATRS